MEVFIVVGAVIAWAITTRYAIVNYLKWKQENKS